VTLKRRLGNSVGPIDDERRPPPSVQLGIETGQVMARAKPEANAESNSEC
jgi:hypothetical protein